MHFKLNLNSLLDQFLQDNKALIDSVDKEARLYGQLITEKLAAQLDLAYRSELESLETALQRSEKRLTELEQRLKDLEGQKETNAD